MSVLLTLSRNIGDVPVADGLAGGGSGYKFSNLEAGETPPKHEIYLRHNGVSKIWNLAVYMQPYTQTYAGDSTAITDYQTILDQGVAGYGFQIDFDYAGTDFAVKTIVTNEICSSMENAIVIPVQSIFYNNAGQKIAVPHAVQGELYPNGDTDKGDTALLKTRWFIPPIENNPGVKQIDLAFIYNLTT